MKIPLYQVDAFSDVPFGGNPAAVCPLGEWLPDDLMQAIAAENNLAETAFFVPGNSAGAYDLRWFTPGSEVDLCGHATLASAHVLFQELGTEGDLLTFSSNSGPLRVSRSEEGYTMDFPAVPVRGFDGPDLITTWLNGVEGTIEGIAMDVLVRVKDEATLANLTPNLAAIAEIDARGLIVTAPASSEGLDFVSRFFAPQVAVPEDPVTGSAHCTLTPYWSEQTGQTEFYARQIGPRSGGMKLSLQGDRVFLTGEAITVITGEFYLPQLI